MPHRSIFAVLAACGSGAASLPSNAAIEPTEIPITLCTTPSRAIKPITSAELQLSATPGDIETLRARLLGVWDGHAFDTSGELGQPGITVQPRDAHVACFDRTGLLTYVGTKSESTCTEPRTKTYVLARDDEASGMFVLRVEISGGCPGDAGYATPYRWLYYVHRLDDRFLVLVDGSTAAVTAYRRR